MIYHFRTYFTSHITRALRHEKLVPKPRIMYDLYLAVKNFALLHRAFLLPASTSGHQVCSNLFALPTYHARVTSCHFRNCLHEPSREQHARSPIAGCARRNAHDLLGILQPEIFCSDLQRPNPIPAVSANSPPFRSLLSKVYKHPNFTPQPSSLYMLEY